MLEARLQFVHYVRIASQYDEVVYIYNYNHNIMASLHNIQLAIRIAPHKIFILQRICECIRTMLFQIASTCRAIFSICI